MKKIIPTLKKLTFHPNRNIRTIITVVYTLAALVVNFFVLQVFCVPVWWTAIALILFLLSLFIYPYISNKYLKIILSLFLGIGVCISIYSIIFLADPWGSYTGYIFFALGVLAFGVGLLPFIFVYYLWHIYRYYKEVDGASRVAIIVGIIIPVVALIIYLLPFKTELEKLNIACRHSCTDSSYEYDCDMGKPETLQPNMYLEQFLGIGIKYHTRIEYVYDGWRPPMHHPFLNIGLWLYSGTYYPWQYLKRTKYYKQFFPNRSYRVNCPCSYMSDGMTYFSGSYWRWKEWGCIAIHDTRRYRLSTAHCTPPHYELSVDVSATFDMTNID